MYNNFFGLAEPPFNITPDSRFLFLGQRHREALGALTYGIRERKGFILLTGEIGAGKTTVCRALIHELRGQGDEVRLAVILNPGLSEIELLKAVNDEFQIPSFYDTKKGLVDALNTFLIKEHEAGHNVVLLIDESQNLEPALLEQIRMLSNLETEDAKLIQIVLVGQPELNDTLGLASLEQLNQRIAVRYHLTALAQDETLAYIKHRLFVARAKVDVEFTEAAIRAAFAATRGVPRKLNVLCDRALLACYAEGSYTVDERIMTRSAQEALGEPGRPTRGAAPGQGRGARLGALGRGTRRAVLGAMALAAVFAALVAAAVVGMKYADARAAVRDPDRAGRPALNTAGAKTGGAGVKPVALVSGLRRPENAADTDPDAPVSTAGVTTKAPKAAPTPPPDWEALRQRQPHWKWDRNAPLVRVNQPRYGQRAAQFSVLRTWGMAFDLNSAAAAGDELLTQYEFTGWGDQRIVTVPIAGGYQEAVRFNVPLVVRLKDRTPDLSAHVALLQAAGESVTVGDPVWGVKTFDSADFAKRWDGATAYFLDKARLSTLRRGEKGERVRALQRFLIDFLKSRPSPDADPKASRAAKAKAAKDAVAGLDADGTFDVRTAQAIGQFQDYYRIKRTEQLDDTTLLLLNARMDRAAPKLNPALD